MAFDNLMQIYYRQGGRSSAFTANGAAYVSENAYGNGVHTQHSITKSATDAFDRGETQFFDPKFSADLTVWPLRQVQAHAVLPKTTYKDKGDSIKVISADPGTASDVTLGVAGSDQLYQYYDTPTMTKIIGGDSIGIKPRIVVTKWKMDMDYILKNESQYVPQFDAAQAKIYFGGHHIQNIDSMLLESVDTPASANFESIERVISSSAEAGYTSATTDVEIYGITARDTSTTYDAQVDSSSTSRNLDLSMINTILTSMQPYTSSPRNIISVAHPLVINMIQDIEGSKQRFTNVMNVELGLNGVKTRAGVEAGFQVNSYLGGGLGPIPIFADSNVDTAGVTIPASNGSIFFMDTNHIEFRVGRPQTYLETGEPDMLAIDYLEKRYLIMYAGQLIANRFNCHGKVASLNGV